jgi:chemotaxis protein CheX
MLENILDTMGEVDFCDDNIIDITGEIANTISGNVRARYGKDFMISVPAVLSGGSHTISYPANTATYIIPVSWKQFEPRLMICLE